MLKLTLSDSIATITLDRPEVHNAFDDRLIQQLSDTLQKIAQDPTVRVVMLAANGKSFCAGADLQWMQGMVNFSKSENLKDALSLATLMRRLNEMPQPTIALIQGPAYGGGVGLVACCDIAIGSEDAVFCLSEVKIGLVPAVISPYVIKAMGERFARRYFLTAEKFNANEALRVGLLHEVTAANELTSRGEQLARILMANYAHAMTVAKQLISKVSGNPIDDSVLKMTSEIIADLRVSEEAQVALKKFLKK